MSLVLLTELKNLNFPVPNLEKSVATDSSTHPSCRGRRNQFRQGTLRLRRHTLAGRHQLSGNLLLLKLLSSKPGQDSEIVSFSFLFTSQNRTAVGVHDVPLDLINLRRQGFLHRFLSFGFYFSPSQWLAKLAKSIKLTEPLRSISQSSHHWGWLQLFSQYLASVPRSTVRRQGKRSGSA